MPSERVHHISKDNKFEIVVIPLGDTGSTKSYKASVKTIVLMACGAVVLIAALILSAIIYTPAGSLLPMSEQQLQLRYGSELFEVQKKLNGLASEVLVLREYNNKLRNALGQKALPVDSTFDIFNIQTTRVNEDEVEEAANNRNLGSQKTDLSVEPAKNSPSASFIFEEKKFKAEFPIIAPAVGYISRRFEAEHNGIDYAGKIGSLVVSVAEGSVVFSGFTVNDGYTIIVSHGDGFLTVYKHNQSILKSTGEIVKRGEPIALLGYSGKSSSGPHLHFELWKDGKAQNPDQYLIASEL